MYRLLYVLSILLGLLLKSNADAEAGVPPCGTHEFAQKTGGAAARLPPYPGGQASRTAKTS